MGEADRFCGHCGTAKEKDQSEIRFSFSSPKESHGAPKVSG
jgi:NADH pyrophosphatase NudC (nudix superfamily)